MSSDRKVPIVPLVSMLLSFLLLATVIFFPVRNARAGAPDPGRAYRTPDEDRTIQVYKAASGAVVFIVTTTLAVDPYDFFPTVQPKEGTGSGIVVDARKGIILTNLHVIQDASKIEILLDDGMSHGAKLVGYDDENDIAVLQLRDPPTNLSAIPFADSSKLEVGQHVLAIGNPFGLNKTLTSGIISSLDRTVKNPKGNIMRGMVQTDAAINPGNSGGPLLDMDGRLVGMNTAILSQSGDSAGIGFAVPINRVKRVLPELIATGKVLHPRIGWILEDTDQGPVVRAVFQSGPAEEAGVEAANRMVSNAFVQGFVVDYSRADFVTAVNGHAVHTRDEVDELVSQSEAGKAISFTMRRGPAGGRERQVSIKPVLQ